jgi:hypothetical protein
MTWDILAETRDPGAAATTAAHAACMEIRGFFFPQTAKKSMRTQCTTGSSVLSVTLLSANGHRNRGTFPLRSLRITRSCHVPFLQFNTNETNVICTVNIYQMIPMRKPLIIFKMIRENSFDVSRSITAQKLLISLFYSPIEIINAARKIESTHPSGAAAGGISNEVD